MLWGSHVPYWYYIVKVKLGVQVKDSVMNSPEPCSLTRGKCWACVGWAKAGVAGLLLLVLNVLAEDLLGG